MEAIYLEEQLKQKISILKPKVKALKYKSGFVTGLSVIVGGVITMVLGLDLGDENKEIQNNIALILGAILTISNGWISVIDYKKLWIKQKTTLLNLYQIKSELEYRVSTKSQVTVDDLFDKYQQIWKKDTSEWRSIINLNSETKKNSPSKGNDL